jgi:hypothetical protein
MRPFVAKSASNPGQKSSREAALDTDSPTSVGTLGTPARGFRPTARGAVR